MKFRREYCIGGLDGKADEIDFVTAYVAENGLRIKVNYMFGNESYRSYTVRCGGGDFHFSYLKEAKAFCEQKGA